MNVPENVKKLRLEGNLASSISEGVLYFKTVMICIASLIVISSWSFLFFFGQNV